MKKMLIESGLEILTSNVWNKDIYDRLPILLLLLLRCITSLTVLAVRHSTTQQTQPMPRESGIFLISSHLRSPSLSKNIYTPFPAQPMSAV
jgi:hypothetical protein